MIPIISTHLYSMSFVRDSQSHKSQLRGHKFTTVTPTKQLTQIGRSYMVTCIVFDAPSPRNPRECEHTPYIFSARQHICYSALYAIARPSVRPSVRLSVPLSVTRVDQSKTVEVRITQPSPQSSPMTLVSSRGTAP